MICPEDTEQWRPVANEPYGKHYEVSNLGRVRRTTGGYRNAKAGRILAAKRDRDGYLNYGLCADGRMYHAKAHTLVLEAFVGPQPPNGVTRHRNAIRSDNHFLNLCWGTVQENVDDRVRHGHQARGMRAARARFTDQQIIAMRRSRASGSRPCDIARQYAMPISTLEKILARHTWRHL